MHQRFLPEHVDQVRQKHNGIHVIVHPECRWEVCEKADSIGSTEGIQKGHMALHARAVSHAAGARGDEAEELRQALIENGEIKIDRARELLRSTRDLTT